jgi:hypothetical protein
MHVLQVLIIPSVLFRLRVPHNGQVYEALGVLEHLTFNLLCRLFIFIIYQFNYYLPNDLYTLLN